MVRFFLTVLMSVGLLTSANAQTRNITSSGNWINPLNWSGALIGGLIDNDDDIVMSNGVFTTILFGQSFTVASFNAAKEGGLTVNSGGTLVIVGNLIIDKTFAIVVDGDLTVQGNVTIDKELDLTVTGSFTIQGNLTLDKDAIMDVDGTVDVGGDANFDKDSELNGVGTVNIGGNCSTNGTPDICADPQIGTGVLPIELLTFEANLHNAGGVLFEWSTASEVNNSHFTLEYSSDGENFESIAEVNGAGNSEDIINYMHHHPENIYGSSYFRLKQTDFDGQESHSHIVALEYGPSDMFVFPNPSEGKFDIVAEGLEGDVNIQVLDSRGIPIYDETVNLSSHLSHYKIDLHHSVSAGNYILKLITQHNILTEYLVIY